MQNWYEVQNIETIDSPALLIYPERYNYNIRKALEITGKLARLRPHVKTHKLPQIIKLHVEKYGIKKFKAATIAEAEMTASNGGEDIILAHQPTAPKIPRLVKLIQTFPNTTFRTIADAEHIIRAISVACVKGKVSCSILLDIDNGMRRSGIPCGEKALELYQLINNLPNVEVGGLHVYDGHIRETSFDKRKLIANTAFDKVADFIKTLHQNKLKVPRIVCGGSPTFPVHALRTEVEVSPGTYIFWDRGYGDKFPDLNFKHAAIVATRIISKMADNIACVDLGHKSIASENQHPRVYFLNCKVDKFLTHSEEHLVIQSEDIKDKKVGDVLYGVPHHICPTVNLNQEVVVIENEKAIKRWEVVARKRQLTI